MFKFIEDIKLAAKAIWTKKTRSFLTMLGVIIGVMAIVLLVGIGEGIKAEISNQIEGLGSNMIFVMPGASNGGVPSPGMMASSTLTDKDVSSIKGISQVKSVVPMSIVALPVSDQKPGLSKEGISGDLSGINNVNQSADSKKGDASVFNNQPIVVMGATPEIDKTFTGQMTSGERYGDMFTQQQYDGAEKVAVIFSGIKDIYYPEISNQDIVEKKIFIGKEEFKIIGMLEVQESGSLFGGNEFSNMVIIPRTTATDITGSDEIHRIVVGVADTNEVENVKGEIKKLLLKNHDGVEDFTIMTQKDLLSMFDKIFSVLTTMLGGIAAVSLLVGGIGVMNIMLVSVSERIKEIGLRKAIGASGFDILIQFLVEAIFLTFLGGAVGVSLAFGSSYIMDVKFGFSPVITWESVALAFIFTVFIGVFFGVAPAVRAARLDPIDALKYE